MKKRLLSILLVLALCAALLPTIALADEPPVITLTQESFDNAGQSGSPVKESYSHYVLLSGSYKLMQDITLDSYIEIPYNATVTLDLNGCTLLCSGAAISFQYYGDRKGTLTLEDSSAGQTGKISGGRITVESGCTFVMNGGTICNAKTGVLNYGSFTMNGGKITNCETGIYNYDSGTVVLNVPTLDATVENLGSFTYQGVTFLGLVKNCLKKSEQEIDGGVFRGTVENGFNPGWPTEGRITGGVFYGDVINYAYDKAGTQKSSEITGGVFYGDVTNMCDKSVKARITGGVFLGEITGAGEKPATSHNITLHFNDDASTVKTGVVFGNKLYPLGEPPIEREGYSFAGWCEDAELTREVTDFENYSVTDNMEFYAKWTRNPSGEDFVVAGGLLSGLLESAANALEETFVDVSRGAYYYNAVQWAENCGIASGVDKKHFAPDESCTRAQAVTMLWRAAGCPAVWTENPFEDVDADDYYYEAVLWAVANGITSGADETHFSPDEPCTRGQIVTFLHRAARCYDAHENFGFVDVKTGSYCEDAINWAVENAITNGTDVGAFSPDDTCTRGQIVTFLYRNR